MVDNIIKKNTTVIYTSSQVSFFKLSMFEPLMELSDMFKYVIDNLPCCDEDWETEKYIRDYVFSYYGYTFVTTLMLGGTAQQTIMMKHDSIKKLESQSISVRNEATVSFFVSLSTAVENSESNTKRQEFLSAIQEEHGTKLGGDPAVKDIHEWAKTVKSNPVIIKFGIREIVDLLTNGRFPNDIQIQNKSKLIKIMLQKYIQQPLYCYNNCTNAEHGTCEASGYFQFGMCKCNKNWTGIDCSVNIAPTGPPPVVYGDVLSGTLCGYDRSKLYQSCNGHRPWNSCPPGYVTQTWKDSDFTTCYKTVTTKNSTNLPGGLCGLWNSGGQYAEISCNRAPLGICPVLGYGLNSFTSSLSGENMFCYKTSSIFLDLLGTLCGIQWRQTNHGPACDGYNPGMSECPTGYALELWTLKNGKTFHLCAKL
ncbi:unnamed protein product [Didymodactylos carnosus]|uniref:Uncharacterized protein n=1 Tax=Didymodactylos carnosus TaxID=1234261 RepID=A0A814J3V4_9BILA|nr:unnamed protein product [Didymodactylos carnosus]CAF1392617.1 unnamed protein product [Didymodactylos carnosus]CAF3803035.1 unnamed protein product [Didymodactylos carnosus]CAF4200068.1 unnamed protein product [Didymodactylos carnosus]